MKIRFLKAGGYSFSPAGLTVVYPSAEDLDKDIIVEGITLSDGTKMNHDQANKMIFDDWAELAESGDDEPDDSDSDIDTETDDSDPGEITDVEAHLKTLIEGKLDSEAKQILQDFGITRLDEKISKSNTVDNMIVKLVALVDEEPAENSAEDSE